MLLTRPEQLQIDLPLEAIARVCQKYGVSELAVFGSVLRPTSTRPVATSIFSCGLWTTIPAIGGTSIWIWRRNSRN